MLIVFSPIFVADTKMTFVDDFVAPLNLRILELFIREVCIFLKK